jgi:hypothetical protein
MDETALRQVVLSGAVVGRGSAVHEEDAVSSQVKGRSLVTLNANDSQVTNAIQPDA